MNKFLYVIFSASLALSSCAPDGIFDSAAELDQVYADLSTRQKLIPSVSPEIDPADSRAVKEALAFLYAYMPLADVVDYPQAFYRMNVNYSLRARDEMPWGKQIPAQLFRHFVLPVRVNNEALDESRMIFYEALKDRVKNLPLKDAILEVNHWCHEKVIYAPSDMRTSSPLATLKSAYGRCGEESTFLVAALRAVGIPARQVYTPRWAHTDDNHAWVEAWAGGEWFFMGACEPEPVLNLGWFNAPASRGLLMHTKVFGRYSGPEQLITQTANYTEIAVTDTYAATAEVTVQVVDVEGKPVKNARVEFKIFNYAEFYTVADLRADSTGTVRFRAGKGDMLVWATDGTKHGIAKAGFGTTSVLKVVLNRTSGIQPSLAFELVPPPEAPVLPEVSAEQRALNTRRMAAEDSIRGEYVASFPDLKKAESLLASIGYGPETAPLLVASRGNWATLISFLKEAKGDKQAVAVRLLQLLSPKDLRDCSAEVLRDHLLQAMPYRQINGQPNPWFDYILNPRVEFEMLTPYRSALQTSVGDALGAAFRTAPVSLVEWCAREIILSTTYHTPRIIQSPVGVWKAKVSDPLSRDIFFVSLARSLGIPAWRDAVDGRLYYVDFSLNPDKGDVKEAILSPRPDTSVAGRLILRYQRTPRLEDPRYGTHFTLSKYENGTYTLLNFDDSKVTWSNTFAWGGAALAAGDYMLTTGTRLANGSVLSHLSFFRIEPRYTTAVQLVMRNDPEKVQVIGSFNSENQYLPLESSTAEGMKSAGKPGTLLQTTGRGYYVLAVLGVGQEPTNHALRDIAKLGAQFEQWGRPIVLLFPDNPHAKVFNPQEFPGLPSTIRYGTDKNNVILKELLANLKLNSYGGLPVIIIADTFNRVVFVSQGYSIGVGDKLLKTISNL